jgi:hypothetical protein
MKNKMIAFCGLDCAVCPALNAAQRLSMDERQKIADEWSKQFKTIITAVEIDCLGCTVLAGQHIGHCAVCKIRLCGLERKVTTCAACPDYGCEKIEAFLKHAQNARANLEALRKA